MWRRRPEGVTSMPTPNPRLEPFVGYRVTLAPDAGASSLPRLAPLHPAVRALLDGQRTATLSLREADALYDARVTRCVARRDRKSTRLNSSHANISYAVFCLKQK